MAAVSEITVRTATVDDIDALMPLELAYCDFYGQSPEPGRLRQLITDLIEEEIGFVLTAADGGELVGFATVSWGVDTTLAAKIAILSDLYVAPGLRGRGLGRSLVQECATRCAEQGITQIKWQTAPENSSARALYDGLACEPQPWLEYWLKTAP